MNAARSQDAEEALLERARGLFRDAGYTDFVLADDRDRCDAFAFGCKSDGSYGIVAVVELKLAPDSRVLELAAPNLLLAKSAQDADYATWSRRMPFGRRMISKSRWNM